jgi:hypothetical protein
LSSCARCSIWNSALLWVVASGTAIAVQYPRCCPARGLPTCEQFPESELKGVVGGEQLGAGDLIVCCGKDEVASGGRGP